MNRTNTIAELYPCIQGEGKRVGVPSILIRLMGCNLRCHWCDTRFTSWEPEAAAYGVDAILPLLDAHPYIDEVILTGGEPTLSPDFEAIVRLCKSRGKQVTVETNGTHPIDPALLGLIDLASLSPKLANSTPLDHARLAEMHEKRRIRLDVLRSWMRHSLDYQLKFVVSDEADLQEIKGLMEQLQADRSHIYLMPEGTTHQQLHPKRIWLADRCIREGFRYCERIHVVIYGDQRGV
ncbi:7-carboxy-7-deazaguanine synthase QueE [Parabacteroides sp. OttesenSCG-928-N08]|nr:7-carboxy-7-deazaguanine synthase QueE [Parabacteroides sp. OttesenSCG-928-N08]